MEMNHDCEKCPSKYEGARKEGSLVRYPRHYEQSEGNRTN